MYTIINKKVNSITTISKIFDIRYKYIEIFQYNKQFFINIGNGKYKGIVQDILVQGVDALCIIKSGGYQLTAFVRNEEQLKVGSVILFDIDETMLWFVEK